jgi:hypothetical protein
VSALNIAAVTVVSIDELDVDDLQREILVSEKFSFTKINLQLSQICLPVVSEVALDQMACCKCRHERQLSRKYCATHYSCKSVGILARFRFAGTCTTKISVIACPIKVKNSYP